MKRDLITIMSSATHGIDYAIAVEVLASHLHANDDRPRQLERRAMLVRELRYLARALEAGVSPFSSLLEPDLEDARGGAEREMDELGVHIMRLQARASRPVDPLDDLVVTVGCEAVHATAVGFLHEAERRGRQHVAKPCTGVRIRHAPTGLAVLSTEERSQHANRAAAARELLYRIAMRQPDGVRVHEDVRAQLSAWAEERGS